MGRLFSRGAPVVGDATPNDAAAIAALHRESFRRGWSEDEIEALLVESDVIADSVRIGGTLVGFILSRVAADEAEILSIAVERSLRGRKLGRMLLQRNLQRLAGLGVASLFLEVDAGNAPALRLYTGMGFEEVGRREGYYRDAQGRPSAALILRRGLN
jgi:ribosomal-protein-alanine N-acetyltransferase